MGNRFEICADEAWTHGCTPPNRYWCFLGGLIGPEHQIDRLESLLRSRVLAYGFNGEVKWSETRPATLPLFTDLVDTFFDEILSSDLRYRQAFLDRSYVHVPDPSAPARTELDVQYRIYYQFLKHQFELRKLPRATRASPHEVIIRLDRHSSQKHQDELNGFVGRLPRLLNRADLKLIVHFVNSKNFVRMGLCDIAMGAAGSWGNRLHDRREPRQRGMKPNQRARHQLAKHVYDRVREVDEKTRGTKAFNWFETTGDRHNGLNHKVRIWKFIPKSHKIDYGFKNKHLDSQGRYCGPRWAE